MFNRPSSKMALQILFFIAAFGLTLLAIQKWNSKPASGQHQDTIEGVSGMNAGETVALPELANLRGGRVALAKEGKYLLFAFFNTSCQGCAIDSELWRDLSAESVNRKQAFYLINVGDDEANIRKFVEAYNLGDVPVLFDPEQRVGKNFKVGFVPQYLLLTSDGQVLKRWDGLRHYDKQKGAAQLAQFFNPGYR